MLNFTSISQSRSHHLWLIRCTLIFAVLGIHDSLAAQSDSKRESRRQKRQTQQESKSQRKKQTSRTSYEVILTGIRAIDASNQPAGGETGATQVRVSPAQYPDDGSGSTIVSDEDRANARTISNRVVRSTGSQPNSRNLSNMIWAWGQFLDHDIDLTLVDAANGTANIAIEDENDPLAPGPISFERSDFVDGTGTSGNPRMQINSITSFIDASNVYGSDDIRAAALREFTGGRLRMSTDNLPPLNDVGLPNAGPGESFLVGDVRGNENVVLTSLHTLFVREHNRLCHLIQLLDPAADDEAVYQLARKIVQAEMQRITYHEFLPALLGDTMQLAPVISPGNPAVATEFSTAGYRFGHSTLSSQIDLVDESATATISLTAAFFNPGFLIDDPFNVDRLIGGLPTQPCQEIDPHVVEDLRTFLFGPPGAGGFDLAALNIQRGRDHGLSDYNSMREAYGLSRVTSFAEITSDADLQLALEEVYQTVDNIDAWIGGLAEDHVSGGSTGEFVRAVLLDQFGRLQSADSFYHEHDRDLQTPIIRAIVDLDELTLRDIIIANTAVRDYPRNPFFTGSSEQSDILAHYDSQENRLYLTGNSSDNKVLLMNTGLGVAVVTGSGSRVNGQSTIMIPADRNLHVTVALGQGQDLFAVSGMNLGDVVVALGDESDRFLTLLSSTEFLASDTEELRLLASRKKNRQRRR